MLYDSDTKIPDENDIPKEDIKLFKGLKMLHLFINDYRDTAEAMSKGIFLDKKHVINNPLCFPIQNLEANLRHLIWQAKQVAEGDYTQQVCFLGEFSDSFNMMIEQLKEREKRHNEELLEVKNENQSLLGTNRMLAEVANKMSDIFLLVSDDNKLIFSNIDESNGGKHSKATVESLFKKIIETNFHNKQWEVIIEPGSQYFNISSFKSSINGQDVYVHLAVDVTSERLKEQSLEEKVYKDDFTGIYNRRYLLMEMQNWVSKKTKFSLCYLDLDNLKYVNDNFGHVYGDSYIKEVVSIISGFIREEDVFARIGGDEFAVLFKNCDEASADKKMKFCSVFIDTKFSDSSSHPRGISYGVLGMDNSEKIDIETALNFADMRMYENKKQRREKANNQYGFKQKKDDIL